MSSFTGRATEEKTSSPQLRLFFRLSAFSQ
jgi:hypothetical protein